MSLDESTTRIVYVSYDRFPSPKGAATHIDAFARSLGKTYENVDLVTVNSEIPQNSETPCLEPYSAPGVAHHPLPVLGGNLIERVLNFRSHLFAWWGERRVPVVHFRSIYEGYPLACLKGKVAEKVVFEVNGLPSIELKYHYPAVAEDRELLAKLYAQEQTALEAADLVLTVSQVNANYLRQRGVTDERLVVIPNGVDLDTFTYQPPRPWEERTVQMLYAGTMSRWQGVFQAIEALALYRRDYPARLTLVGPKRPWQKRDLINWAWELGVYEHVELLEPVSRQALAELHHQADVILAPLTANDRNLVQGCCPLKVLEAMASGTPLIGSDLPVVRELVEFDQEGLLVRPGSAKAIKDAMLRLREDGELGQRLSAQARRRVEGQFTWSKAQRSLIQAYEDVLGVKRPNTLPKTADSAPE